MKKCWYALLLIPLLAFADGDISKVNSSIRVNAGETAGDVSSVNGSITIEDGATTQDVETVNGSITIEDRVSVREVDTVNGGIRLGDEVKAESVETVNGKVRFGAGARVAQGVATVNGSIEVAKGGELLGKVETVNGSISLDAAQVGAGLKTTNGNITVGANSRVDGGILVEKPRGNWFSSHRKRPTITIGPDAVVNGTLEFEHDVNLFVSNRAKIGPVSGATAIMFDGEEPSSADREKVER